MKKYNYMIHNNYMVQLCTIYRDLNETIRNPYFVWEDDGG